MADDLGKEEGGVDSGFRPPLWPRDRGALWGLAWSQGCILAQQRDHGRGLLSECGRLPVPPGSQGSLGLKCLQGVRKRSAFAPQPQEKTWRWKLGLLKNWRGHILCPRALEEDADPLRVTP